MFLHLKRLKHYLLGEHSKALSSGAVCVSVFTAVLSVLISTAPAVWGQRSYADEYPTHKEIATYLSQENSRVAVLQSNQDQVMATIRVNQTIIASNSERISVLENNMGALMKIAWATMFGVFAMLSKGVFETYQRASMRSVRAIRNGNPVNGG